MDDHTILYESRYMDAYEADATPISLRSRENTVLFIQEILI